MTHDGESSCIEICEKTIGVTQGEIDGRVFLPIKNFKQSGVYKSCRFWH